MNANQIKDRIKEIGLTQNKVAELVGCNHIHLSGALTGSKVLSEGLRLKIVEVLKKYD